MKTRKCALHLGAAMESFGALFDPARIKLEEQFGQVTVSHNPQDLIGVDVAFVPFIPGNSLADTSTFPCPAIGLDSVVMDSPLQFTRQTPLIDIITTTELSYPSFKQLNALLQSLDLITSWRLSGRARPMVKSILIVEDNAGLARGLTRLLRTDLFGSPIITVAENLTEARKQAANHQLLFVDGKLSHDESYAETDQFVVELLADPNPPAIFRLSAGAHQINQPGLGLLWKGGRTGEIEYRTRAVLDWIGRPLEPT